MSMRPWTYGFDSVSELVNTVPEKSLTISGIMAIFVSLLYVIWKMVATEQRISVLSWRLNGLPFSEIQDWFRWSYRTEAPTRTTIRSLVNKIQRTGNVWDEKRSARSSTSSQETVETIVTGDRAESKSVNTSSQSGKRHPKVHCVANLALRTGKKCLSHPRCWASPNSAFTVHFVLWSNNHVNIVPGYTWAIPEAPIVYRQHSGFGGVLTGRRPTALCAHCP